MSRNSTLGRAISVVVSACICAIITSCNVGPNYQRPGQSVPTTFKSAATRDSDQPRLAADWWHLFNDPILTQLEEDAIAANTDLQAAMARVAQARAAVQVTMSQFYPVVTLDPAFSRSRTPAGRVTSRSAVRLRRAGEPVAITAFPLMSVMKSISGGACGG
jgi:multidrug efflux system outer membrane protein